MNIAWAKSILEVLADLDMRQVCLGSGSRSTPLAVALADHPEIETMLHFDERGLGFLALGMAKATRRPVAVVVTSGTAVGNLFPAIMEAFHDRVPLIVITADRPPELRGCGSNQTADQIKIFGNYAYYLDLPCPDTAFPLGKRLSHALSLKMPVHINCPFKEPLLASSEKTFSTEITRYEPSFQTLALSTIQEWAERLSVQSRGCIVIGGLKACRDPEAIFDLAKKLGWSVYADVTSNLRGCGPCLQEMPLHAEAILHLGGRLIAKTWPEAPLYCLVADDHDLLDPSHQLTHRIACDPSYFCRTLLPYIEDSGREALLEYKDWRPFFDALDAIYEPGVVFSLNDLMPPYWNLFVGNSMPIRDVNRFFFPKTPSGEVFTNRGLSGIDGNIATALGIALATHKPTLALIGDLTFLHDLNSLAMLKKTTALLVLVVINNGGGGIFSFLPAAENNELLENYVAAAHSFELGHAARLFDIPYHHPNTKEEWAVTLSECVERNQSCIIELTTGRAENKALHDEISRLSSFMDFWAHEKIGVASPPS